MLEAKVRIAGVSNIVARQTKRGKILPGQGVRLIADEPILPTSTIIINQCKVKFVPGKEYLLTIKKLSDRKPKPKKTKNKSKKVKKS